jgi:dihydrolipoamide dehydrogenase
MSTRIAILGAGPGGYVAAIRAAQLGAQVSVIERDNIGGTCLNYGCIPTKALKTTAELLETFRRAHEMGVKVDGEVWPNMTRLMVRKQRVIDEFAEGILRIFDSYKIQFLKSEGYVLEPNRIRAKGMRNSTADVVSDKMILAIGSRPLEIPSLPFDGHKVISSDEAISLNEVPESILIIGGGIIGCEFAFIFNSFGSSVTLVEAMSRLIPLPSVDADCSIIIQREMRKRKIRVLLNNTVARAEFNEGKVRAFIKPALSGEELNGAEEKQLIQEVDKILVCVGRKPNTQSMGLENLGLQMDNNGWITTNDFMETTVPGVYAIGDALGPAKAMLAHVASAEGLVAAENALGISRKMSYETLPVGIWTSPEIACVGVTEEQARERRYTVRADKFLFRALGKAQAMGEIAGHVKIISDVQNKRVLGIHIVGPHATDLIAEGTLAIKMGATVDDVAETIHAHPTLSEALMEVSHRALDAGIHYLKGD